MRLFVQQGRVLLLLTTAALFAVIPAAFAQDEDVAVVEETEIIDGQDSVPTVPVNHTITVVANPPHGGVVSRNPDQTYYAVGTNVNVMATPAEGYVFTGWSGDTVNTASTITVSVDGTKTLTANFRYVEHTYRLTTRAYPADGGTITRSPDREVYAADEEVILIATPNSGYAFTGWTGTVAGRTNRLTVKMNGDKNVTANFYKQSIRASKQQPASGEKPPLKHTTWGLGAHWGFDFSMNMKNGADKMEPIGGIFDLNQIPSFEIPDLSEIPEELIPDSIGFISIPYPYLKMSRSDWKRSALNFGGKIFVDVVPYIDIIEVSMNLGVWEYTCNASYLDVDAINKRMFPADGPTIGEEGDGDGSPLGEWPRKLTEDDISYKNIPLSLEENGMAYFGLKGTPYAKLQLDASLRKILFRSRRFDFNAGAGVSVNFATPLLNKGLIESVQQDRGLETPEDLVNAFLDDADGMGNDIIQKILDELFTPRFGAHIVVGMRVKLSSLVGIYVDGKYIIPLSKYDENEQVRTSGILINTGLSLSF